MSWNAVKIPNSVKKNKESSNPQYGINRQYPIEFCDEIVAKICILCPYWSHNPDNVGDYTTPSTSLHRDI